LLRKAPALALAAAGAVFLFLAVDTQTGSAGTACESLSPGKYERQLTSGSQTHCFALAPQQGQLLVAVAEFAEPADDINLSLFLGGNLIAESNCDGGWGCTNSGTGREALSVYSDSGASYELRVSSDNNPGPYQLKIEAFAFGPNASCSGPSEDCREKVPFPAPFEGAPYFFNDGISGADRGGEAKYRIGHKRALEAYFYAVTETLDDHPDAGPLGMVDIGGYKKTPGYELNPDRPRHPLGTHRGNDLDVAYFRTSGANNAGAVCPNSNGYCTGNPTGLDYEVLATFISKLVDSPYIRIIIVDPRIGRPIESAARSMFSSSKASKIDRLLCWGEAVGGRYHHDHMHISFQHKTETGQGCSTSD
jgi:hypothetical protein